MNGKDRNDLDVILQRMEQADVDRRAIHKDIKFIKDNLFNPHKGLWAEAKLNTQFRENATKWRSVIGTGLIVVVIERLYSFFS